jgi:hypothetical protein
LVVPAARGAAAGFGVGPAEAVGTTDSAVAANTTAANNDLAGKDRMPGSLIGVHDCHS